MRAVFGWNVTPAPSSAHGCMTNGECTVHTLFSLFTVSTMDTCSAAGPFKGPFLFNYLWCIRPASANCSYVMCTVVRLKTPWQAWHTLVFPWLLLIGGEELLLSSWKHQINSVFICHNQTPYNVQWNSFYARTRNNHLIWWNKIISIRRKHILLNIWIN